MFNRPPAEKPELEKLIDELTSHLRNLDATADSDEFNDVSKKLSKLHKLRDKKPKQSVSPDTIAVVAGNILTTIIVVKYERLHVMGSQALKYLTPNRLR